MLALVRCLVLLIVCVLGFLLFRGYLRRVPVHDLYGTRYETAFGETILVRAAGLIVWLVSGWEIAWVVSGLIVGVP